MNDSQLYSTAGQLSLTLALALSLPLALALALPLTAAITVCQEAVQPSCSVLRKLTGPANPLGRGEAFAPDHHGR